MVTMHHWNNKLPIKPCIGLAENQAPISVAFIVLESISRFRCIAQTKSRACYSHRERLKAGILSMRICAIPAQRFSRKLDVAGIARSGLDIERLSIQPCLMVKMRWV